MTTNPRRLGWLDGDGGTLGTSAEAARIGLRRHGPTALELAAPGLPRRLRWSGGRGWAMAIAHGLAAGLVLCLAGAAAAQEPDAVQPWPEVARQGITRLVIVPMPQARDRDAYERQIARLCQDQVRCFINFYTNSTGAVLGTPLPDAVWQEPTAVYRLSDKRGAAQFRWSCRLGLEPSTCF